MLNGLDPILIFNFEKILAGSLDVSSIPLASSLGVEKIALPSIPLYLSEKLTGLFIDTEDKNIDIETKIDTAADGEDPTTAQRAVGSTIKVSMLAKKDSLGLILLTSMADLIVPKLTSQEYSITYLHGATTVFEGLLHTFGVQQTTENDLLSITLEISKTTERTKKKPTEPTVDRAPEAADLKSGTAPTKALKTPLKGPPPKTTLPTQPPVYMNRGASGNF